MSKIVYEDILYFVIDNHIVIGYDKEIDGLK